MFFLDYKPFLSTWNMGTVYWFLRIFTKALWVSYNSIKRHYLVYLMSDLNVKPSICFCLFLSLYSIFIVLFLTVNYAFLQLPDWQWEQCFITFFIFHLLAFKDYETCNKGSRLEEFSGMLSPSDLWTSLLIS